MEKTKTETKKETKKEHQKPWQEVYASIEDIKAFLNERVMLRYNVITKRTEVHVIERDPDPPQEGAPPEAYVRWMEESLRPSPAVEPDAYYVPLVDRQVNTLWSAMSRRQPVRLQDMQRVIESDFVPEYHPFRHYLEHLPPWHEGDDDYIMELSLTVNVKGGADEQIRFLEYLRKWLVAMVAAWVEPRVVNNVMLVLIGEQGAYKTTWFANLLPPPLRRYFYTKTNANRMTRDDLLTLSQYGLVCCEELDTMRPSELNQLKAAMTMPSIDERAAYARYSEHREHVASFCGTGNNVQFLSDTTGTRRWLPFEVESIESPLAQPFRHDGIFAQAYALYRNGFRYWFDRPEIERLLRHNERFETVHSELELIDLHFRKPVGSEPREVVSATTALQLIGGNIAHMLSKEKIGQAFARLGFEYRRTATQRGYVAVHRTGVEMEAYRRTLAEKNTAETMTDDSMTAIF